MDLVTLKKKLHNYESGKGYLKNVGEDVLYLLFRQMCLT